MNEAHSLVAAAHRYAGADLRVQRHAARLRFLALAARFGSIWLQVQLDERAMGGIPRTFPDNDSLWACAVRYAQSPTPHNARLLLAETRSASPHNDDLLHRAALKYRAANNKEVQ